VDQMLYIETEFNKRKVGIREVLLTFSFVLLVLYAIIFLAYRDSAAYYMAVLEKVEKQESEFLLLDDRNLEVHEKIKEMLNEELDN
jgi:cell division protein FtsB